MQNSGPPALRFCSIPLSAFEGKRRRTGSRDTGNPHKSVLYADREPTQRSALGSVLLESGNGAVPGTVPSFSYSEVDHRGNLIDCRRNFRLDKLLPRTKHHRSARTKKRSQHSVGVK